MTPTWQDHTCTCTCTHTQAAVEDPGHVQMAQEAARLAEKNTRLGEEKEQLLQRLLTGQASGRDLGLAGEVSARSLQSKASLLQRFGFGGAKGSRKGR